MIQLNDYLKALCTTQRSTSIPATLLVVAHPDDETIAVGARLQRFTTLTIVHLTNGVPCDIRFTQAAGFDSREQYAQARRNELTNALRVSGTKHPQLITFGLVDQEVIFCLPRCITLLMDLISKTKPVALITHAYEGGHPDHDAAAVCTTIACNGVQYGGHMKPFLLEFPAYHDRDGMYITGQFLPSTETEWVAPLSEHEQIIKRTMFECFTTQREILNLMTLDAERFRQMPLYDFSLPPHSGTLFYERMGWNINGTSWRKAVTDMLATFSSINVHFDSRDTRSTT